MKLGPRLLQNRKDENVPLGYPSPFWEIGFGAAEVEVDVETGEVKVMRYVSLTDAGKMINPVQCHAQDEGAAVFGLGQALFEDLVYQDGQLLNGSLVDYRLPRFDDLPSTFKTFIMEGGGGPGPYGAKGMGEGGILPVAPAVSNAVFAAVGKRLQVVPLTPGACLAGAQQDIRHVESFASLKSGTGESFFSSEVIKSTAIALMRQGSRTIRVTDNMRHRG